MRKNKSQYIQITDEEAYVAGALLKRAEGVKNDAGKPRLDLVPVSAVLALGEVLTMGATKYEEENWRKGMKWGRVFAAALRHLMAWWDRRGLDPESGLSHLKHALTNLAFLVEYEQKGLGEDTRPGKEVK